MITFRKYKSFQKAPEVAHAFLDNSTKGRSPKVKS